MSQAELASNASAVLSAWRLEGARLAPIVSGHINRTFRVEAAGQRFILQRVNPIFGPLVQEDIEAITAHLENAGMTTPRLVRTKSGELYTKDPEGSVWRVLTFVEGETHAKASDASLCRAAAALVASFHRATAGLSYEFKHRRPHVHDTPRHLHNLETALTTHVGHRAYGDILPVAREILARARELPSFAKLPERIAHGDLKLTNILFKKSGEALALVDLDTLAPMALPLELGDAWRSWCNPHGEDNPACVFELSYFEAALDGYGGAARLVSVDEARALPYASLTIALELASRFCADALNESYFGWDATRFASASEHNLLRARSQLQLARSLGDAQATIDRLVHKAFAQS